MLGRVRQSPLRGIKREIVDLLDRRIQKLGYRGGSEIQKNLMVLKKMFSLTQQETEFCIFVYIISNYEALENFFVDHLECQKFHGRKYLTNILALTPGQLNDILGGTLEKIGLFEMDRHYLRLEDGFQGLFENTSAQVVSKNFFSRIPHSTLPLEHHFAGKEQTEHILKLLEEKLKTSTHILLYGPPGTGKTSFAYGLAKRLGIPAYGIVRGEENTTKNRRAAILACLNMANTGQGSLILVDEADNILNTRFSWFMRGETQDKGWLNDLLEEPGSRMIWITNRIDDIEESVLRRFALSLHFKPFNRRQRIRLWGSIFRRNRVKRFFSESDIADLASRYRVSAGAIDLAVKKALEAGPGSKRRFHEAVALALDAHQSLLNSGEKPVGKERIEKDNSLDGLNIEGDLPSMIGQLEKFDEFLRHSGQEKRVNMNLLFYGPPGTGKSELARYIAERLDREIMCRRVSDLHSMWVGEAEKNIKHAFAQAEADEAILIIDEADSLLFSRDRAHHSWEISFTNEFLTQMERFRGILICTTNRLIDIDHASIRRFNHKMGFKYLKADANVTFYRNLLEPLTNIPLDEASQEALKRIPELAPGDFRVVRDKYSFYPSEKVTHQLLIQALQEEVRVKKVHEGSKYIGF
jgi:SpoVK/Ycf46/Vps4 family AAA+-type ATPase